MGTVAVSSSSACFCSALRACARESRGGVNAEHHRCAASGYRQLALVDRRGGTAQFSSAYTLGTHYVAVANGVVAAGKLLSSGAVPDALTQSMVKAFEATHGLIALPSVSRTPNLNLIAYNTQLLSDVASQFETVGTWDGARAAPFAAIGPRDRPGVILSGHADVVPVEGKAWPGDPFKMRRDGARHHGRGTADVKGFVAAAIQVA